MDKLTPLLHAFYTCDLPPSQRQSLHTQLLSALQSPQTLPLTLSYLSLTPPSDALTLHFTLHCIEHSTRTSFSQLPSSLRTSLLSTLQSFLISAYSHSLPPHILHKASHVTVHLAIREWLINPSHSFPADILSLIHQNGHTPDSLPRIFSGMSLLCSLIDFTASTQHTDLLHAQTLHLSKLVSNMADSIISALEIGMRINGPHFPKHVSINAVRSLAQLTRIQPTVAQQSLHVLQRCVHGTCDQVGAETFAVLADVIDMRITRIDMQGTLAHLADVLERVAMGEIDGVEEWAERLMMYTEASIRRALTINGVERVLNALMGVTVKWKDLDRFQAVLDAWICVLECVEDEEVEGEVWKKVYVSLSELCVRRAFMDQTGDVDVIHGEWEYIAGVMAQVAEDGVGGLVEEDEDVAEKCVQAVVLCARLDEQRVAEGVAGVVRGALEGESSKMGAYIAYCLATVVKQQVAAAMFEMLCNAIEKGKWKENDQTAVALFRAAAALVKGIGGIEIQAVTRLGGALALTAKQALQSDTEVVAVSAAVLLVALEQQWGSVLFGNEPAVSVETVLTTKYKGVATVGTGAMTRWALVPKRDAKGLPQKWSEEEWRNRQCAFTHICEQLFGGFFGACVAGISDGMLEEIERGAALVLTMVLCTAGVHGRTREALWYSGVQEVAKGLVTVLGRLRMEVEVVDIDARRRICGVMSGVISSIGCILEHLKTYSGGGGIAAQTVDVILQVAGRLGNVRLARAALNLVREQIAWGVEELVDSGIQLAVQMVNGESDVAVAAVSVLMEALKTHWMKFWPGDAVGRGGGKGGGEVYFAALMGIVNAIKSEDLAVCRAGLLALQTLHAARRLFERKAAFGVGEEVVKECVKILTDGRQSLGDEAVQVVYGIAQAGGVENVLGGGWDRDRNGFVRKLREFATDFAVRERVGEVRL